VIGREFVRRLRWSHGRIEIVTNRFELDAQGRLIEHVTLEMQERSLTTPPRTPAAQSTPLVLQRPAANGRLQR
jgi:hypothetical protein